jgi:transcription elongation factor Elf1
MTEANIVRTCPSCGDGLRSTWLAVLKRSIYHCLHCSRYYEVELKDVTQDIREKRHAKSKEVSKESVST